MGDVIISFMERYNKEFDFYLNLSKKVEDHIRGKLHSFGVRAIVSSRAKSPKRLREKIIDRNDSTPYTSVESIYSDIVDLAGVRVALYFPGDVNKVEEIILKEFNIEGEPKSFPEKKKKSSRNHTYEKVFSGYGAKHFRVKMKGTGRYANNYPVEIQVASVLMHAWSEVEHDLVYKPLQGSLSHEELMILDEINGLVLSGNLALERLQLAGIKRTESDNYEFKNHYDLAMFFVSCLSHESIDNVNFNDIFKILKLMGKTKRNELSDVVSWIKENPVPKVSPVQQNVIRRRRRDPASQLYEYIINAIVSTYPDEATMLLEKCSDDVVGDYELADKARDSLFKFLRRHYFGAPDYNVVIDFVEDYEFNYTFLDKTKEDSLIQSMSDKDITFSKPMSEILDIIDDYIALKDTLSVDNFSKALIDMIIRESKLLSELIISVPSNSNEISPQD